LNILLRTALFGVLCGLLGCQQRAGEKTDATLQSVNREFLRLKNGGLMPGLERDARGGSAGIWRVGTATRMQAWFAPLLPDLGQCQKAYGVDVHISSRRLVYLFCFDLETPQLIRGFEEHDGHFVPIPAPAGQKPPATNSPTGQMP
jgi:hypothetical protein